MGFLIKDKNGFAIAHSELDKDASKIWNIPNYIGRWASPSEEEFEKTWIEIIGRNISNPIVNITTGWNNVKSSMFVQQAEKMQIFFSIPHYSEEDQILKLRDIQLFLQPYYKLIKYWQNKGYTPHKIN